MPRFARTSMEVTTANDRKNRQNKMGRFTGAQDASEKQLWLLGKLLGQHSRSQMVRYVEWSNQMYSGTGTLDRYETGKVFLSRVYFIRAIQMAKFGHNDLTTEAEELGAASGMTEAEWLAGQDAFAFFDDLPPMPQTGV